MSVTPWRNTAFVLAIVCLLLVGYLGVLGWQHFRQTLEVVFAGEQTGILDDMRAQALASQSVDEIRNSLNYTESYYPSGTKQRIGSTLDRIVERYRAAVLREIRAHLDEVERSNP